MDNIKDNWEKYWQNTSQTSMTFLGKKMLKVKRAALKKTLKEISFETAIDVGCGSGFLLEVFKESGKVVAGIDISQSAVKICTEKGLSARVCKLEDVTEKYDLVFSDGLLEHFLDFEFYVKELIRISSKYVLIIQTNHSSPFIRFCLWLELIFKGEENIYEYNYRIEDFVRSFEKNGAVFLRQIGIFNGAFAMLLFEKAGVK